MISNQQLTLSCFFLTLIIFISTAGPNSNATIFIDYNALTIQNDKYVSSNTGEKYIAVKIRDVKDLDGYSFTISYDTVLYRYVRVLNKAPQTEGLPFLESKGGKSGPVLVKNYPSGIEISTSLIGNSRSEAPDGEGVLAVIVFEQISSGTGVFQLDSCELIDSDLNYDMLKSGMKGNGDEK
jgi:hypothetical protein